MAPAYHSIFVGVASISSQFFCAVSVIINRPFHKVFSHLPSTSVFSGVPHHLLMLCVVSVLALLIFTPFCIVFANCYALVRAHAHNATWHLKVFIKSQISLYCTCWSSWILFRLIKWLDPLISRASQDSYQLFIALWLPLLYHVP